MSRSHDKRGPLSAAAIKAAGHPQARGDQEPYLIDETESDITPEELQDFMSADIFEVPADPAFKNRLREKLWELVDSSAFGYGPRDKG